MAKQKNLPEHPLQNPSLTPPQVHAHVMEHINEGSHDLSDALSHPNLSGDSLKALHAHYASHADDEPAEFADVLSHPKMPKEHAENFLREKGHSKDWGSRRVTRRLTERPDLDPGHFEALAGKMVADPSFEEGDVTREVGGRMSADAIVQAARESQKWEPEHGEMTSAQKATNSRISKLNALVNGYLHHSKDHSPESTQKIVEALGSKAPKGVEGWDHSDALASYVKGNPHLTHNQLETIFTGDKHSAAKQAVLTHPSVDPAFLSRLALMPETAKEGKKKDFATDIRPAAVTSPFLPPETRKKIVEQLDPTKDYDKPTIQALADDPNLSADEIRAMAAKGISHALKHPNAPHDAMQTAWDANPAARTQTDTARDFLSMRNLPQSILRDLVNHKNTNVAVDALSHPNVDEGVLQAALDRKSKAVNAAAAKHPKAPKTATYEKLQSGHISGHAHLFDERRNGSLGTSEGASDPKSVGIISQRYAGTSPENIQSTEGKGADAEAKYYSVKAHLATSPHVPAAEREAHMADLGKLVGGDVSEIYRMPGHFGQAMGALTRGVEEGSPAARKFALTQKNGLSTVDASKESYDSDFLDQLAQSAQKGTYGHDRHAVSEVLKDIAGNPNSSKDTFNRVALDPKFAQEQSQFRTGQSDGGTTIYDERINNLPEAEQPAAAREIFSKLAAQGSHSAVIHSAHATPQEWQQSFDAATPEQQDELLNARGAFTHASENDLGRRMKAVMGMLGDKSPAAAEDVLRYQNPDSPHAQSILKAAAARTSNREDQDALDPKVFVKAIASNGMLDDERLPQTLETLKQANASPDLYADIVNHQMNDHRFRYKEDGQKISTLQDILKQVPPEKQESFAAQVLDGSAEQLHEMAPALREAGVFDFLAADKNSDAFRAASAMGLTNEMDPTYSDPEGLKSILNSDIPAKSKANIYKQVASMPDLSPGQALQLAARSHNFALTGEEVSRGRGRQDASSRQNRVAQAKTSITNIVNGLAKDASDPASQSANTLTMLASNIGRDASQAGPTSHVTKGDMDEIIDHFTGAVLAAPLTGPQKFQAIDSLRDDRSMNTFYKNVKAKGDLGSAIYAMHAKGDQAPQIVKDMVTSIAKNPAKLSPEQLYQTVGNLKYLNADAETSVSLVKSAEKRLAELPPEAQVQAKNDIVNGLGGATTSSDDSDFMHFATDKLLHYAAGPDTAKNAQEHLTAILDESRSDRAVQQKIIDNLPVDSQFAEARYRDDPTLMLAPDLCTPENLEQATHGWKLRAMMNSYIALDESAKSVLNRRVLKNGITPEDSAYVANALAQSDTSAEDAVGLARSLNPTDISKTMWMAAQQADDATDTSIHHLVDPAISQISSYPANGDDASYWTAMHDYADVISRYESSASVKDGAAKQESINRLTHAVLDSVGHHLAASASGDEPARVAIVKHASDTLAKMLNDKRRFDHAASSKSLEMIGKLRSGITPENLAGHYKNWSKTSAVKDDQWGDAYSKHPALTEAIGHSERLPAAAITAFPVDQLGSAGFTKALEVADPKGRAGYLKPIAAHLHKLLAEKKHSNLLARDPAVKSMKQIVDTAPSVLSAEQMKDMMGHDSIRDIGLNAGAGGKEFYDHVLNHPITKQDKDVLYALAKSPHAEEKLLGKIAKLPAPGAWASVFAANPYVETAQIKKAIKLVDDSEFPGFNLPNGVLQNPNVPEEIFNRSVEEQLGSGVLDEPGDLADIMHNSFTAIQNPKYGLKAMLDMPIVRTVHPELAKTVKSDKLPTEAKFSPLRDKFDQAVRSMGPQGMDWATFKKANPKLENVPEIKSLFMSKQSGSGVVSPEELLAAADKAKTSTFPLTYGYWDGAQRHSEEPNLVVQTNTHKELQDELAKDPKFAKFFQLIQKAGNSSSHPSTPHTVGWARVDTSAGKKGWIIEEFQSDFSSQLRRDVESGLKQIKNKLAEEGVHATPEEIQQMTGKIEKSIQGWHEANMKAVEDAARAHGVTHIFMHGPDIRSTMSGMSENRELPVKLVEMYGKNPPKQGFSECDYTDYPNWSEETKEEVRLNKKRTSTKCWVKKL